MSRLEVFSIEMGSPSGPCEGYAKKTCLFSLVPVLDMPA